MSRCSSDVKVDVLIALVEVSNGLLLETRLLHVPAEHVRVVVDLVVSCVTADVEDEFFKVIVEHVCPEHSVLVNTSVLISVDSCSAIDVSDIGHQVVYIVVTSC